MHNINRRHPVIQSVLVEPTEKLVPKNIAFSFLCASISSAALVIQITLHLLRRKITAVVHVTKMVTLICNLFFVNYQSINDPHIFVSPLKTRKYSSNHNQHKHKKQWNVPSLGQSKHTGAGKCQCDANRSIRRKKGMF
jgi:hypothetical protein